MIAVISLFGLYRYVWLGQIPRWQELRAQVQQEKAALAKARAEADKLPGLQQEVKEVNKQIGALREQFQVSLTDGNPYVEMGFRSRDKVILTGVNPQPIQNKGYYQVLPVDIELRGSYIGHLQFIKALESLPNMSEISGIQMSAVDGGAYPELQSSLTLLLYSITDSVPGKLRGQWQLGRFDIFSPALQQILDTVDKPGEEQTGPSTPQSGGSSLGSKKSSGSKPVYHFPLR